MQSRLSSLIESLITVAIGFVVSLLITSAVFPAPTLGENLGVTLIFTGASIARQYVVRRFFNARIRAASDRLARL
jgi:hypothetical protein